MDAARFATRADRMHTRLLAAIWPPDPPPEKRSPRRAGNLAGAGLDFVMVSNHPNTATHPTLQREIASAAA